MRTKTFVGISLAGALCVGAFFLTGCATRGYLKAKDTSISLATAAGQIETARQQLAATTAALSTLINQPNADLRKSFESYRSAVNGLEKAIGAVTSEADQMQKQGQQYFDAWNEQLAQIQNENIRARSAARKQEVAQQFNLIQQQYLTAQQQFSPLLSRLRDIERLLSVDLTPTGVRTVHDFAVPALGDAANLRVTLDQLADNFRSVSGALSSNTSG